MANYSNKGDPLGFLVDTDHTLYAGIAETVVNTVYLKKNEIYDDDRNMMDERLTHTYVDAYNYGAATKTRLNPVAYCTEAQIDGGSCEPYMEIIWRSAFEKLKIQRRYKTSFEAFSEIGGFVDLINYGILAIYFYYNTRSYLRFIRSQLIEGFVELDQKRVEEEDKKTPGEIRKVVDKLKEMKLEKEEPRADKLSFKEVFKTKAELKKLVRLSFKSKILEEALIKNKLLFDTLAAQMIFLSKKSTKKSQKIITN